MTSLKEELIGFLLWYYKEEIALDHPDMEQVISELEIIVDEYLSGKTIPKKDSI